jgi:hypothetical protein
MFPFIAKLGEKRIAAKTIFASPTTSTTLAWRLSAVFIGLLASTRVCEKVRESFQVKKLFTHFLKASYQLKKSCFGSVRNPDFVTRETSNSNVHRAFFCKSSAQKSFLKNSFVKQNG